MKKIHHAKVTTGSIMEYYVGRYAETNVECLARCIQEELPHISVGFKTICGYVRRYLKEIASGTALIAAAR